MSELNVGDKVIFKGRYNVRIIKRKWKFGDYVNTGYKMLNLSGKTGILIKIDKDQQLQHGANYNLFIFKLDENDKEIILSSNQLRNILIIPNDDILKKIESGELVNIKMSKLLTRALKNMKFKIKGEYFDISNLDVILDNPDYISFVPAKKINLDLEKNKQNGKVGRVLKKLNPDLSDVNLEEFVNKYKAEIEYLNKEASLDVVTGDKISYWYNQKNYEKEGGSLNNSCMRYSTSNNCIKFYDSYPDKIALAIITKGDKLVARALIWKLDSGEVYMDRIYSTKEKYRVQLENYALENKMLLYKNIMAYSNSNNKILNRIQVTLKNYWSDKKHLWGSGKVDFPYFDTFTIKLTQDKQGKKDLVLYRTIRY